jgi:hypothetical protein
VALSVRNWCVHAAQVVIVESENGLPSKSGRAVIRVTCENHAACGEFFP